MVKHPTSEMTLPPAEMAISCFQFQDLIICRKSLKNNKLPPPPRFSAISSLFAFHREGEDRRDDARCSIRGRVGSGFCGSIFAAAA